ncbi:hypothetical protein [Dapis sp. BLCC M172]|uniref:hypothetical protein n=1 Tax=Dapis sp. BLCC M172 TaxID=2975281 RepID=UPI003CF59AF6
MSLYYRLLWSTILILASIFITNLSVLASTKKTSLSIESNNNNSYKSLVEQAEKLAQKTIDQEFANNPEITKITITILGERKSQIVPVIRSTVSRSEWQKNADIDEFTRYFADAKLLLKFEDDSDAEAIPETKSPLPKSPPQVPAPPSPSYDSQPIIPQPQKKSPRQKPGANSPRFPTDEDDTEIIDD